ncbi:hypothetical protein CHS0354_016479 [Potamilus streckersoni]|uniref:Cysteine and tyrosine-rich protein 1 n=1 Tax=Potamilus streckersoni TaxID=2493646 RepID=A0AAE0WDQ9_9BIVA|nr:hypothetical protein CHS0354_016479 [Potamilus streckersoni]
MFHSSEGPVAAVGVIAGSVVGGLAGLAILIGVIVCCCVAVRRSSRRPGLVIQPTTTNAQAIVVSSTAFTQGPPPNPGPYGPAVIALGITPPGYVQYNNPAYPPPPLSKH